MRVLVLIDGEHYPPVVRDAIASLSEAGNEVAAAVFCGGTEKVTMSEAGSVYGGVPVVSGAEPLDALRRALTDHRPDVVVDLSGDPVLRPGERFRLASEALTRGVAYRGADFELRPPTFERILTKPSIRVIATGKRAGKTAVCGALARHASALGHRPVVVAMGRGGPPSPEVLEMGTELTPQALVSLARSGRHAASDYIEDAVTSRVTTIGCRRVGGGLAGAVFSSNVVEGARIAESRDEDLVLLEGSGAEIPPVEARATLLCVPAAGGAAAVTEVLGPLRVLLADLAVVTLAEEGAPAADVEAAIHRICAGVPVVRTVFRPRPLRPIEGRRVFFCSTAPEGSSPVLRAHLEEVHDCEVVGMSHNLSDRSALEAELRDAPDHDVLLTELKAASVDLAAAHALEAGRDVVFADNGLVATDPEGVVAAFDRLLRRVAERG